MRILLLCSAFNGLSQRAWIELSGAGHEVVVQVVSDEAGARAAVAGTDPELVICPFLRSRIPADVWATRPTVVLHPGPKGDRGPSSLDWAIMDAEPLWGATAVQAVEQMDAGPIWASGTFAMPGLPPRKSELYNGPVTETAIRLIHEVVIEAASAGFVPEPLDYDRPDVTGRLREPARQGDRRFSWTDPTERVLRRIRAADGSPGVQASLCGVPVSVFDAHPATLRPSQYGPPGTIAMRRHGAVLVRTGDGGIWIGQLRSRLNPASPGLKLPATTVLAEALPDVAEAPPDAGFREIHYTRSGPVGILSFDFYNGAMSTEQCHRLFTAVRHATAQDTRVLLLRGGQSFSNGIHLGVIEAAPDPAAEAWVNIIAIDDVCREIITCTGQLTVCSVAGNAGAGGVMLALGADHVVLRDGAVLNPHYRTMGLYGSEYWTYVLPRRVGRFEAHALTSRCLPIGAEDALRIGLADRTMPGDHEQFEAGVAQYAHQLAVGADYPTRLAAKLDARAADEHRKPLQAYRNAELDQMSQDMFDDRNGFAQARQAFLSHQVRPDRDADHERVGERVVGSDVDLRQCLR